MTGTATVHVAGMVVDGVQACSRCGEPLIDGRGVMSMDGSMHFWGVGAMVATAGYQWWVRTGTLEDNEIPCGRRQ